MVRKAVYGDIPKICALVLEMYGRSRYVGRDEVDVKYLKALLMQSIQRYGAPGPGGTAVFVTEAVDGFILGITDRVYHIGHRLMATDLYWYVSPFAASGDRGWIRLFDAFEAWATGNEAVIEIKPGITDAVDPDYERKVKFFERRGYARSGIILERKIR